MNTLKKVPHPDPIQLAIEVLSDANDEIKPVSRVTKDGGDYTVKCPHCLRLIGLEGDDLSQIRGEQFQHKHCGGWLEVTHEARFVPVL